MLIKIKILKRINEVTYACSLTQNRTFKAVMKNKNGGGLDGYNGEPRFGDEKVYIDKQQMRTRMYLT